MLFNLWNLENKISFKLYYISEWRWRCVINVQLGRNWFLRNLETLWIILWFWSETGEKLWKNGSSSFLFRFISLCAMEIDVANYSSIIRRIGGIFGRFIGRNIEKQGDNEAHRNGANKSSSFRRACDTISLVLHVRQREEFKWKIVDAK